MPPSDTTRRDVVHIDDRRRHPEPPPLEMSPPDDYDAAPSRSPRDLAERAVLGAMLGSTDPDACATATSHLVGHDFHQHRYELIYDAAVHLYSRGKPVDIVTVADQLGNTLAQVGGMAELAALAFDAGSVIDAGYYAALVAKHAHKARLHTALEAAQADLRGSGDDTSPNELHAAVLERLQSIPTGVPGVDDEQTHPWAPVDLGEILAGDLTGPKATLLTRRDGKQLLYPATVSSIAGEPGSGKTWLALIGAAQELAAGRPVLYLDFEDRPQSLVARLLSIGVTPDQIRAGLRYVRPHVALGPDGWTHLERAAAGVQLAVVDGITEAMTLHGLSLMDNEDVARWLALLPRRLADLGPAVLQIDHVVKNSESRGRYAIGGQHKLAGIDGCAYKMLVIKSFGKGIRGQAKVVLDKDKHGDVGPIGMTVADVHLDATNPDGTFAWLDAPENSYDDEGQFRPTVLMERVSNFLLTTPGPQSQASVCTGVKGKEKSIVEAIDALLREGYVRVETGPRNARLITYLEAFPRADS